MKSPRYESYPARPTTVGINPRIPVVHESPGLGASLKSPKNTATDSTRLYTARGLPLQVRNRISYEDLSGANQRFRTLAAEKFSTL